LYFLYFFLYVCVFVVFCVSVIFVFFCVFLCFLCFLCFLYFLYLLYLLLLLYLSSATHFILWSYKTGTKLLLTLYFTWFSYRDYLVVIRRHLNTLQNASCLPSLVMKFSGRYSWPKYLQLWEANWSKFDITKRLILCFKKHVIDINFVWLGNRMTKNMPLWLR